MPNGCGEEEVEQEVEPLDIPVDFESNPSCVLTVVMLNWSLQQTIVLKGHFTSPKHLV